MVKTLSDFKVHPAADLFPMIPPGDDWDELVRSIKAGGLLDPIVVDGDELLDGRNRLKACAEAGVEPRFVEFSTLGWADGKVMFILAKNFDRRSITDDQRASIWDKANWMDHEEKSAARKAATQLAGRSNTGTPIRSDGVSVTLNSTQPKKPRNKTAVQEAAQAAGVSEHKMRQAAKVRKAVQAGKVPEKIITDVVTGKVKLNEALAMIPANPKQHVSENPPTLRDRVLKKLTSLINSFEKKEHAKVRAIIKEELQ